MAELLCLGLESTNGAVEAGTRTRTETILPHAVFYMQRARKQTHDTDCNKGLVILVTIN